MHIVFQLVMARTRKKTSSTTPTPSVKRRRTPTEKAKQTAGPTKKTTITRGKQPSSAGRRQNAGLNSGQSSSDRMSGTVDLKATVDELKKTASCY